MSLVCMLCALKEIKAEVEEDEGTTVRRRARRA